MANIISLAGAQADPERYHGFFDDFTHYVTADLWTSLVTDTGTVAVSDGAGGIVVLTPSDGSIADNDEAGLITTTELFKFVANKPLIFGCRMQYTELATSAAGVAIGIADDMATDFIGDTDGVLDADFDGAIFYKVDGNTRWSCHTADGTTKKDTDLSAANSLDKTAHTAGTASAYQILEIVVTPVAAAAMDVDFFIDDLTNGRVHVCKHSRATFAGAGEMHAGVYVKNGSAHNQTVNVDYIYCYQRR